MGGRQLCVNSGVSVAKELLMAFEYLYFFRSAFSDHKSTSLALNTLAGGRALVMAS